MCASGGGLFALRGALVRFQPRLPTPSALTPQRRDAHSAAPRCRRPLASVPAAPQSFRLRADQNRAKIDAWIAVARETRIVETTRAGNGWTTQALEDGEVRYQETEFGADEPELNLLAEWCERRAKRIDARPPVKTSGVPLSGLPRKQIN